MPVTRDARRRRNRLLAWFAVVVSTAVAAMASTRVPAVQPIEALLADVWTRLVAPGASPSDELVIVTLDEPSLRRLGGWPLSPEELSRLIVTLEEAEPRAVGVLVPTDASLREEFPEVVFAASLEHDLYAPDLVIPAESERAALEAGRGGRVGAPVVRLEDGVVRRAGLLWDLEEVDRSLPAFDLAVALARWQLETSDIVRGEGELRAGDHVIPLADDGRVRIRWAGPTLSHPWVPAYRVLAGELPAATFAGKVVLIGPTDPAVATAYATPCDPSRPMPAVEVSANAIGTLLTGRFVERIAWPWLLGVLLVAGFGLGLAPRRMPPVAAFVVFAVATAAAPAACFVAFAAFDTLVPVVPFLVLTGILYVGMSLVTARALDAEMQELVDRFTRLDRGFYQAQAREERGWDRALDLASLFIDAESFLLFRKSPDRWHIELAGALRTSDDDVLERRRDVRRSPWAEAIALGEPIVRGRLMKGDRQSLIVPLMSVGPVVGFLVVNQPLGGESLFLDRRQMIRFVAEQLATLMNRELLRERLRRRAGGVRGFLEADRGRDRLDGLATVTNSLLEKKVLLFSVLNAIDQGVIICDVFGRVVLYNERIAQVGKALGRPIEGKNVLDVLRDVADLEPAEVVRRMGEMIVQDRPIRFDLTSQGQHGYHYRLELRSVRKAALAGEVEATAAPVLGIVCSFTDVTELKELDLMKTDFVSMISGRVLNLLTSIQGYSEILLDSPTLEPEARVFAQIIKRQSQTVGGAFQDFASALELGSGETEQRRLPLSVAHLLEAVLERRTGELEQKQITLERTGSSESDVAVLGNREMIEHSLEKIVSLVVDNAFRESKLEAGLEREAGFLRVSLTCEGAGLPGDRLEKLFERSVSSVAEEGDDTVDLSSVRDAIDLHGGTVDATGQLGKGLKIVLRLPVFMKFDADGDGGPTAEDGDEGIDPYGELDGEAEADGEVEDVATARSGSGRYRVDDGAGS